MLLTKVVLSTVSSIVSVYSQNILMSIYPTLWVPFMTDTLSLIDRFYRRGTRDTYAEPTTSESPSLAITALSSKIASYN